MNELLAFITDPDVVTSGLFALFIVNGLLTITLAFRCLDPVRFEGIAVAVLSVVAFVISANVIDGRENMVALAQLGQFALLAILNFAYRRPPLPRRQVMRELQGEDK